ncbi:MAG: addiction module antidote protein, HigA family [Nitrospirae bacterium]|nr:addiction module antidote protein, HigA family [Nitrospirota bacterium]
MGITKNNCTRPVTGEIALLLGRYLSQTPQFWINLQTNYDMQTAEEKIGRELKAIKPYKLAHAV